MKKACIPLLVLLCALYGCTINIYHPSAEATDRTSPVVEDSAKGRPLPREGRVSAESVLDVEVYGSGGGEKVITGDSLTLRINTAVDAFVSCYYQQGNGDTYKLFPNQHATDSWVAAENTLFLPGADRFEIVADRPEQLEQFMCLMSGEDVLPLLPPVYRANQFQRIPVVNFDDLYKVFRDATDQNLVARVVSVEVQ